MDSDFKWLIGTTLAFVSLVGGIIARDRNLMAMLEDMKDQLRGHTTRTGNELHERVNSVKDEYVRRVDLDGHIVRIEKSMDGLRADAKTHNDAVNTRLDHILTQLTKK